MRPAEKLVKRLKDDLGIEADLSTFRRIMTGRHSRAAGSALWSMNLVGGSMNEVLGYDTVTNCLRKDRRLTAYGYDTTTNWWGDIQIDAEKVTS